MLRAAGFLRKVSAHVVAPALPTCNGNTYDFSVVPDAVKDAVVAAYRVTGVRTTPHWPVRLLLRGGCARKMKRIIVRPPTVPGSLPQGPLPEQTVWTKDAGDFKPIVVAATGTGGPMGAHPLSRRARQWIRPKE